MTHDRPEVSAPPLRYVALGDSYTVGTSVETAECWPDQLVARLAGRLDLVANLAVDGSTTGDVIERQLPALEPLRPELVSILIGVNDVVQGVPEPLVGRRLAAILDALAGHVGASRVLVVTTPDYTVTPRGADYGDPVQQAAAIRRVNASLTALAQARGIAAIEIHGLSLQAAADRSLVAADGLHPSGRQYAAWVDAIAPALAKMLRLEG